MLPKFRRSKRDIIKFQHPRWGKADHPSRISNCDFQVHQGYVRRFSESCGGLVEMPSRFEGRRDFIRLMHQTIKEFVDAPGFKQLVLGTRALETYENASSFYSKGSLSWTYRMTTVPTLATMNGSFRSAETSTGKSQKALLDSFGSFASQSHLKAQYGLRAHYGLQAYGLISEVPKGPFRSTYKVEMLQFAIREGLYLYLRDTVREDPSALEKLPDELRRKGELLLVKFSQGQDNRAH